jgi:hypothetical protein
VRVGVSPNRAAATNQFSVALDRRGKAVTGADVVAKLEMLDMSMGSQSLQLAEREPGTYSRSSPGLVMAGHWGVTFRVQPPGARSFDVALLDRASG